MKTPIVISRTRAIDLMMSSWRPRRMSGKWGLSHIPALENVMNRLLMALTVLIGLLASCDTSLAQPGASALPWLLITTSVEGNGRGGTGATLPTTDPAAVMANPAQLGIFSLGNTFSASTYSPKVDWLPGFGFPSPVTLNVDALSAGFNFGDALSLPVSASVGVGYSRAFLDLGKYTVFSPFSSLAVGAVDANEKSESYSVGVGLEYLFKIGLGFNFKKVTSHEPNYVTGGPVAVTSTPSARDFGVLLQVPLDSLAAQVAGNRLMIGAALRPALDLSLGYVRSNVGDEVRFDAGQPGDPLPRSAVVGLGVRAGLATRLGGKEQQLVSFALVRQADDELTIRHPDGTYVFKNGLGDIRLWDNVILGKTTGYVAVRKGWEVGVADCLVVRGGSVIGDGFDYATTGYTISLGGMLRLLAFADARFADAPWFTYVGDHIDLQFQSATYFVSSQSISSPLNGTSFQALSLVIRGVPW